MLNIRNKETERLVRELAARRGVGMTQAIHEAVAKEVATLPPVRKLSYEERLASIRQIQAEVRAALTPGAPSVEEIMDDMYDEWGAPR
jgi:antitoxin VapB